MTKHSLFVREHKALLVAHNYCAPDLLDRHGKSLSYLNREIHKYLSQVV